jgi:uncharacterized protein (TIGR03067 family)
MKRFYYLALIASLFISFTSCNNGSSLVGEWEGTEDSYSEEILIFSENGDCRIIKDGKLEGVMEGTEMKYEVDNKQNPHHIDIILQDAATKDALVRIRGIYEMLGENTLRICLITDMDRPGLTRPDFFNEENTSIYTRK